jgi:hypothetical protein
MTVMAYFEHHKSTMHKMPSNRSVRGVARAAEKSRTKAPSLHSTTRSIEKSMGHSLTAPKISRGKPGSSWKRAVKAAPRVQIGNIRGGSSLYGTPLRVTGKRRASSVARRKEISIFD